MVRYIKVNQKVVQYLHLENDRNKVKDGNYILWLQDIMPLGPLPMLYETLARVGGIALLPHEAREEQYGINNRPLPTATDPEFVVEASAPANEPEPEPGNGESEAQGETPNGESEEITAGEVGNVEDIVDFEPEQEPGAEGESEQTESETPNEE